MAGVQQVVKGPKTFGAGITGQPVKLLENYFPISSYTNLCLYKYKVDFSPEVDIMSTKRGLLGQHRGHLGGYLFDGTMLFSGIRFNPPTFKLTSKRRQDDQMVVITVKFTNVIETGDYANSPVFKLLLHSCLRHLKITLNGRIYCNPITMMAQQKLQIWPGYETTFSRYEDIIFLMNDSIANTFLKHIEQVINESNPAMILCVISSAGGDVYGLIKRKLCIDREVPSQVVLLKILQKNNTSVCSKLYIQINDKLGSAPLSVTILKIFKLFTSVSDITKALEFRPKPLKRKISSSIQDNINTEIIKPKFVKYSKPTPVGFIDLTIDSEPTSSGVIDLTIDSEPDSSMDAITPFNDNLLLHKAISPPLCMDAPSDVKVLVVDENSEISTKNLNEMKYGEEWKSPRTMTIFQETGQSTSQIGTTVILPFAIKRLSKSNQHSP